MRTIGGIPIKSTRESFNKFSRMAGLVWSKTGVGKTTLMGTVDAMCQKYMEGKRALILACDQGDGSGTQSIRKLDVPFCEPKSLKDMNSLIAGVKLEKDIGAVIVDDGTSFSIEYVTPVALNFEQRKAREDEKALRSAGVPARSDYQTIGELARQFVLSLINLSTFGHPENSPDQCELRKHVFMTAQERVKYDQKGETIEYVGPAFPGSLPLVISTLFPLLFALKIGKEQGTGNTIRYVQTSSDNPKELIKDRSGLFERHADADILTWYEKYWLPELGKVGG